MRRRLIILLLALPAFAQDVAPEQDAAPRETVAPREDLPPLVRKPRAVSTLPARAIHISAPDGETKVIMLRWARRLVDKLEKRLGLSSSFERRSLWVTVREDDGLPDAICEQSYAFGEVRQNLIIRQLDIVDRDVADAALCRALLMGWVNEKWSSVSGDDRVYAEWIGQTVPSVVPEWVSLALARGLHPQLRSEDSRRVTRAMEQGQLPSLVQFFLKVQGAQRDSLAEARLLVAMGTELFEWLLSFADPSTRFDLLVQSLADGHTPGVEWLQRLVPGVDSATDLQTEWERWLAGHKLRILVPGLTHPEDLEALKDLLVFSVGSTEEASAPMPAIHLRELVRERERFSLDAIVRIRTHELRVLALGRSAAFAALVERYCTILAGLIEPIETQDLLELISQAEREHANLLHEVRKNSATGRTIGE